MGATEIYWGKRYIITTGHVVPGARDTIEEREAELLEFFGETFGHRTQSRGREPYDRISWDGELPESVVNLAREGTRVRELINNTATQLNYPSESEADLALAGALRDRLIPGHEIESALKHRRKRLGSKQKDAQYFVRTVETALASPINPNTYFVKKTFIPAVLGRTMQRVTHMKVGIDYHLYHYVEGVYKNDGEACARIKTRFVLGDRFKRTHPEEVIAWLKAHPIEITDRPPTNLINVANGLFYWESEELQPHTPDVITTIQLPVKWNPTARCRLVEEFLSEVILEDAIEFVLEVIGYTLYAGNPMRKAVMLLGLGCNGKTVLLNLIQALVGDNNVSSISLQMLAENRFSAAQLLGKIANICGDLDARSVQRSEIFKKVTGGDAVAAEWKFKPIFEFRPYALLLFSANELPHTSDQTPAWFSRWLIVPMDARIEKIDPHLTAKLTSEAELEGLLVLAVRGLRRLMARGHFKIPESVRAAGDRYRARVDSVWAFINEFCEFDLSVSTDRVVLYESYSHWMNAGNRLPVSRENFYEYIRRNYDGQVDEKKIHSRRHFRGIRYLGGTTGGPQPKNEDQS